MECNHAVATDKYDSGIKYAAILDTWENND